MTTPEPAAAPAKPSLFGAIAALTTLIATLCLCALVLVLAWQVFGRYVLNASPGWTEPVALTLMSVAALCGAALGVRRESHFNFPTLLESLPAPIKAALKLVARLIACAFGVALAYYGALLMLDAWDVPMAGAPMPEGMGFVGLVLGGSLIALFALERIFTGDAPAEQS